jgi:3-hydroxyisobutyrate dehydrogenase-like beta-hydroxyacid dehydrogenase
MVTPRLATTFVSGRRESVDQVRTVLDAISGPWVYTGAFGTGAQMKYLANLLIAVHTVAAAEVIALARSFGLDLDLVQHTLDNSIASSAIPEATRPAHAGPPVDPRSRPDRHPAFHPGTDRGRRGGQRCPHSGLRLRQGGLRPGRHRRVGR